MGRRICVMRTFFFALRFGETEKSNGSFCFWVCVIRIYAGVAFGTHGPEPRKKVELNVGGKNEL